MPRGLRCAEAHVLVSIVDKQLAHDELVEESWPCGGPSHQRRRKLIGGNAAETRPTRCASTPVSDWPVSMRRLACSRPGGSPRQIGLAPDAGGRVADLRVFSHVDEVGRAPYRLRRRTSRAPERSPASASQSDMKARTLRDMRSHARSQLPDIARWLASSAFVPQSGRSPQKARPVNGDDYAHRSSLAAATARKLAGQRGVDRVQAFRAVQGDTTRLRVRKGLFRSWVTAATLPRADSVRQRLDQSLARQDAWRMKLRRWWT